MSVFPLELTSKYFSKKGPYATAHQHLPPKQKSPEYTENSERGPQECNTISAQSIIRHNTNKNFMSHTKKRSDKIPNVHSKEILASLQVFQKFNK